MKKITFACSVVLAAALLTGCNKKTNPEPQQDTEKQSAVDVAYSTQTVADIDVVASFLGENLLNSVFLQPAPGSTGSIPTPNRDTNNKVLSITYNGSVTCRDSKKRNGSIVVSYSSNPITYAAKFYRQPGFFCDVTLNNYQVDGWMIDDVTPIRITNTTAKPVGSANLTWDITAELTFTNVADPTKNMTWKGTLHKTLVNTSDPVVYNQNGLIPIGWLVTYTTGGSTIGGAQIEYTGDATGKTQVDKAFTMKIDEYKESMPLKTYFNCSPDKVLGITTTTTVPIQALPVYEEWHPFVSGYVSYTTAAAPEARKLDFSSDGTAACDNKGTVVIKGISYAVDFQK